MEQTEILAKNLNSQLDHLPHITKLLVHQYIVQQYNAMLLNGIIVIILTLAILILIKAYKRAIYNDNDDLRIFVMEGLLGIFVFFDIAGVIYIMCIINSLSAPLVSLIQSIH